MFFVLRRCNLKQQTTVLFLYITGSGLLFVLREISWRHEIKRSFLNFSHSKSLTYSEIIIFETSLLGCYGPNITKFNDTCNVKKIFLTTGKLVQTKKNQKCNIKII